MDYPTNGDVDAYLDRALQYTFTKEIDEVSLNSGTVVLYSASTHVAVDGNLSYEADTLTIKFLPYKNLTPNSSYTWSIAGESEDTAIPLKYADGTNFLISKYIDFTTGVRSYRQQKADQLQKESLEHDVIDDGQSLAEYETDVFKVTGAIPSHLDSSVDVLLNTVSITFSQDIKTGQDFSSLISFRYSPLVRETFFFNKGKFKPVVIDTIPGETEPLVEALPYRMPEGTWAIASDSKTLVWTQDADQNNFNANAYVYVIINKDLLDTSDNPLNSAQDESFYFLTTIFPMYTNVESIILGLNGLSGSISEEVALQFILKYSIEACKLGGENLARPSRAAQKFTEASTIVSLIDNKVIQNQIQRGRDIKLGELSVSSQFPRSAVVDRFQIRVDAAKDKENAKRELISNRGISDLVVPTATWTMPKVPLVVQNQVHLRHPIKFQEYYNRDRYAFPYSHPYLVPHTHIHT